MAVKRPLARRASQRNDVAAEQSVDGVGECRGPVPIGERADFGVHQFRERGIAVGDYRRAAGQRFQRDEPEGLLAAGVDEQVRGCD